MKTCQGEFPLVSRAGAELRAIAVGMSGERNAAVGKEQVNSELCLG